MRRGPRRRQIVGLCAAAACVGLLIGARTAGAEFTLPVFPIAAGDDAYSAPIISVVDHAGRFYTGCCDVDIVAFTGEAATRGASPELCPVAPDPPACLFALCICGYRHPQGLPFVVNGAYQGALFDTSVLSYDGHAGTDYRYAQGTPLVAPRAGTLCKALEDPINGRAGAATAWEKFHTYYIDHGAFAGHGWSTWYLHAVDMETDALRALGPGECTAVAEGEPVARIGAFGTFAPHLHFEVRRHPVGASPESVAARVIDPYGWTGDYPDPWLQASNNPQAAHRASAVWAVPEPAPALLSGAALYTLAALVALGRAGASSRTTGLSPCSPTSPCSPGPLRARGCRSRASREPRTRPGRRRPSH